MSIGYFIFKFQPSETDTLTNGTYSNSLYIYSIGTALPNGHIIYNKPLIISSTYKLYDTSLTFNYYKTIIRESVIVRYMEYLCYRLICGNNIHNLLSNFYMN